MSFLRNAFSKLQAIRPLDLFAAAPVDELRSITFRRRGRLTDWLWWHLRMVFSEVMRDAPRDASNIGQRLTHPLGGRFIAGSFGVRFQLQRLVLGLLGAVSLFSFSGGENLFRLLFALPGTILFTTLLGYVVVKAGNGLAYYYRTLRSYGTGISAIYARDWRAIDAMVRNGEFLPDTFQRLNLEMVSALPLRLTEARLQEAKARLRTYLAFKQQDGENLSPRRRPKALQVEFDALVEKVDLEPKPAMVPWTGDAQETASRKPEYTPPNSSSRY